MTVSTRSCLAGNAPPAGAGASTVAPNFACVRQSLAVERGPVDLTGPRHVVLDRGMRVLPFPGRAYRRDHIGQSRPSRPGAKCGQDGAGAALAQPVVADHRAHDDQRVRRRTVGLLVLENASSERFGVPAGQVVEGAVPPDRHPVAGADQCVAGERIEVPVREVAVDPRQERLDAGVVKDELGPRAGEQFGGLVVQIGAARRRNESQRLPTRLSGRLDGWLGDVRGARRPLWGLRSSVSHCRLPSRVQARYRGCPWCRSSMTD